MVTIYYSQDDQVIVPENISKVYKVGDKIATVRILGYSLVDGWALGTNIQKVVEE